MAKLKKYLKVSSLSAYTIAKNCTDLYDCNVGKEELLEWKELREINNLEIPQTYYNRLANINKKITKLKNKKK